MIDRVLRFTKNKGLWLLVFLIVVTTVWQLAKNLEFLENEQLINERIENLKKFNAEARLTVDIIKKRQEAEKAIDSLENKRIYLLTEVECIRQEMEMAMDSLNDLQGYIEYLENDK